MKPVLTLLCIALAVSAQESPDSKGKDFWFCFMPNYHNGGITNASAQQRDSVFVFIAAEKPTTVTLEFTPVRWPPIATACASDRRPTADAHHRDGLLGS